MSNQTAFRTTAEYEWELGILTRWSPYLEAAGIFDPSMNAQTVYLVAGEIMHDEVVEQRHGVFMRNWRPSEKEIIPPSRDYYLQVLCTMTPQEKRELKQRVYARVFRRKP